MKLLPHSGQYMCFAKNEWGTATSNSVFVRAAILNNFKVSLFVNLKSAISLLEYHWFQPPSKIYRSSHRSRKQWRKENLSSSPARLLMAGPSPTSTGWYRWGWWWGGELRMMWFMCVLMEQKCILDVAKLKPPSTGNKLSDIVSYERGLEIETPHILLFWGSLLDISYSEAAN